MIENAVADTQEQLGTLLRRARTQRRVSQSSLARRTGIHQSAISRIEAGSEVPSLARARRLLAGLGLRLNVGLAPLAESRLDPAHLEAIRRLSPGERIEQGAAWSAFADELRGKARAG